MSSLLRLDGEFLRYLSRIIFKINLYFGSVIFLIGIVGNVLNIVILSQRSLRSNPCVIIFITSSITGIITLLFGLTPVILSTWSLNAFYDVQWICKFDVFIAYTFQSMTYWLIMLATIDRWIVSSPNARLRHLSSRINAFRSIFCIIFLSVIVYSPVLYCYQTHAQNILLKCLNKDEKCLLINDLTFGIVTVLLPLILITIFGWKTILNIRSSQSRIEPMTTVTILSPPSQVLKNERRRRFKKSEHFLFVMLFIQVILLTCFTLPIAIEKLYVTFTWNVHRSNMRVMIEGIIYDINLLLSYIAVGMQFYANTLSGGRVFRNALTNLFQSIIRKITCR